MPQFLERLRSVRSAESINQQRLDFIDSLDQDTLVNLGALITVVDILNNREYGRIRYSIVGSKHIVFDKGLPLIENGEYVEKPEFKIINDSPDGSEMRQKARGLLLKELKDQFDLESGNFMTESFQNTAYSLVDLSYSGSTTRFFVSGERWDDSSQLKLVHSLSNSNQVLLNPQF